MEFGLIREKGELRIYGAGIISSPQETVFSLENDSPNRIEFDLQRIMRTRYIIDDFQQTYFVIDSFEALLDVCYRDFGDIYHQVRDLSDLEAHDVIPGDNLITRGTHAYFDKKAKG